MKESTVNKFYILITSLDYDSMEANHHRSASRYSTTSGRSRIYNTKEEALDKARRYIGEEKSDRYFVMEAVMEVRKVPVEVEELIVTEIKGDQEA